VSAVGEGLSELFEQHERMAYELCRALLRDPDDADDADSGPGDVDEVDKGEPETPA